MLDIVLSLLLEAVFEKLSSPVLEQLRDLYNLRENIKKLQHSLPKIQAFLEDAETRQATEKVVQIWLSNLKDIAYGSEDLWDELAVEIMLCERRSSIKDQVCGFLLPFEPSRKLFNLANELQDKLKVLDGIAKEGMDLNFRALARDQREYSESPGTRKATGSFVVKSKIYGREKDKKRLIEKLLLPSDPKGKTKGDLSIIPIVGIGGLGKTTLARLVYNDEKINRYFDLRIWVYASQVFDVRKLIITIVESANKKCCKLLEMDLLQSQLQESLCGKKFLLVLDDVWNEDQEEWDELGDLLKSCVEGSKIVVTTRSKKVAAVMGTTSAYLLKGLLEKDCWDLFKKQAFGEEDEEKHPILVEIGKRIIQKCAGVPLAVKVMGSLLRFKRDEKDWIFVEESELWSFKECKSGILPALRLSYNHLPLHLRRCFVFCSLIPKNYEIQKEKLIHTWMANGLIKPVRGNRVLEDIGDDYFNDLLCLAFFEEVEKSDDGSMSYYKMHDLIHDLAKSIGGDEFEILGHGLATSYLAQIRHSSIVCNFEPSSFPLFEAKHLRTLLFLSPGGNSEELSSHLPEKFIYLRVLDLSGSGIKQLPESVSAFICLRYLDLSNTSIQALPHTICNLCCLQTLNLSGCYNLVELPFGIANVVSLRHINTTGCHGLIRIPAGIGKLLHLQTLTTYIVGKGPGESIAELNFLNLRGELNIKCLENVRDAKEAKMANMREKRHLHSLSFQWEISDECHIKKPAKGTTPCEVLRRRSLGSVGSSLGIAFNDVEDVFQCLEPHPNLKKLFIKGYLGLKLPLWNLPNLVVIVLINCRRCEILPTIGKLPCLKTLCLQGMDGITRIGKAFYGKDTRKPFPSLKELTLRDFPNLEEWSSVGSSETFSCLQKLIIDKCPNLETLQALFPSLEHLELRDCHPKIMDSMRNITSLSILVIDTFLELPRLPGELLENNRRLASLEILSCQNLHSLPSELESLASLKSLIISSCDELSYLPLGLQKLKLLEFLEINGCHNMTLLPGDGLKGLISLQNLSIENCTNLISLSTGLCQLTSLEQLSIMSCPKLISLPDGLQNLYSLRSLTIVSCPELFSLPGSLQHVTTLQSLVIHSCPGLTALPDWFGKLSSLRSLAISNCNYLISFPEGLRRLSKLQHLSVQDCLHLERRCKNKRGKEWHKIAHIPHVYIGSLKFGK